jgi:hypothetical protein
MSTFNLEQSECQVPYVLYTRTVRVQYARNYLTSWPVNVCTYSTQPPIYRLQAEVVVRRPASKAVLGSSGAAPASTQPGGRPPAPTPLARAHPGVCEWRPRPVDPESAEAA